MSIVIVSQEKERAERGTVHERQHGSPIFTFFRFFRPSLLALIVITSSTAFAADKPDPSQPWWVRCKTPLSPEVEKALAEIAAKMAPLRKKDIGEHMEDVMARLFETTALTDEAKRKAIRGASSAALEETMKPWPQAVTETNRIRIAANGVRPSAETVKTWNVELQALARLVLGCKLPDQQPVWAQALKANLSPGQLAKWEEVVSEARKKREEQISALLKPWADNYREAGNQMMETRITAMAAELKLDEERKSQLRDSAGKVVDRICDDEVDHAAEALRFEIDRRFEQSRSRNRGIFNGYEMDMNPAEDREWQAALKRIVKPGELAAWDKHVAEEKAEFDKEIPALLKPALEQMTQYWKSGLDTEVNNLVVTLGLNEERTKALEPAGKAALKRAEDRYMSLAKQQLDKVDSVYRAQILKRGRYYVRFDESEMPQNDPAFKESLQQLLTPEERNRLAAAIEARKTRRGSVMSLVMVAELDKKLALTGPQRERLLPLAGRLVKDVEELFPQHRTNYSYDFEPRKFFAAAANAKSDDLKGILDTIQLSRWRELSEGAGAADDPRLSGSRIAGGDGKAEEPQRKPEPEDVDVYVSDYLDRKTEAERRRLLEIMLLQAEDVARVAALPADTAAHLLTAARGAAERELAPWKASTERNTRSNIQGATAANVKQRLAGMEGYYYERRDPKAGTSQSVWKKTLDARLSEAQKAAWQKEVDARRDFFWRTVVQAVLAEFDRRHVLTADQWDRLEPLVSKIVKDYSEDIEGYFSGGYSTPWYLQTYSSLLPMAGVPEKEMKTILSKAQWDRWAGEDLGNAMNYWDSIENNHKNRVQQKR